MQYNRTEPMKRGDATPNRREGATLSAHYAAHSESPDGEGEWDVALWPPRSTPPSEQRQVAQKALLLTTQPRHEMRRQFACSIAFTRPTPKWLHSEGTRAAHSDGKSVRAREEVRRDGREGRPLLAPLVRSLSLAGACSRSSPEKRRL